jgi:hypothetical protein
MLTCFVCKKAIAIFVMFIQKFKTMCNKYAKKPLGMQKKAVFTENNTKKNSRLDATALYLLCF